MLQGGGVSVVECPGCIAWRLKPGANALAFLLLNCLSATHCNRVTSPLALLLYERLLPGSALGNKLRDQGYRILHVTNLTDIAAIAAGEKPLVAFVDLEWKATDASAAIRALKESPATHHVPILAFSSPRNVKLRDAALAAGATIIASDEAILSQLSAMLDQAMMVE